LGRNINRMVKKTKIFLFGASSGIASKLINYLKKEYDVYAFFNKNKIKNSSNVKKIKLNLLNNKEILSKLNNINIRKSNLVIINFAAIKIDKLSININEKDIFKTFDINTFSFLKILQILLPSMIRRKWGRVINISSTGGLTGEKGTLLYSTSKSASLSMMRVMSQEYGLFNITFNSLILGNFNFGLFKTLKTKIKKNIIQNIPSRKTGKIVNIFNAIDFLINSEYVNGSSIKIDGGYLN